MLDSVFLSCNNCKSGFWFEFTYGCMKTGKATTECEKCKSVITLSLGEMFEDGCGVVNIDGATRGLFLSVKPYAGQQ